MEGPLVISVSAAWHVVTEALVEQLLGHPAWHRADAGDLVSRQPR